MSTDKWLILTFVTSSELTNHYTWQQVLIEKREIKAKQEYYAGRVRVTLTWRELFHKIKNIAPFHEGILGSGVTCILNNLYSK